MMKAEDTSCCNSGYTAISMPISLSASAQLKGSLNSIKEAIAIDSQSICFVYPTGEIIISSQRFIPPDCPQSVNRSAQQIIHI
jgi:hypothetical protein